MKRRNFVISEFECTVCNQKITLPRRKNRMKEKGHIKDVYCPTCKEISKFFEIRTCDNYKNWYGELQDIENI